MPILAIIIVPVAAAGSGLGIVVLALLFMFTISDYSSEPGQINTFNQDKPCVPNAGSWISLLDQADKAEKAGAVYNIQTATELTRRVGGHWVAKGSEVRVLGRGERFVNVPWFTVVSLIDVPGKPECSARKQDLEIGFWQWAKWKWWRSEAQEKADWELGEKHANASLASQKRNPNCCAPRPWRGL